MLIEKIEDEACKQGFKSLYLHTFEAGLPEWYATLGWSKIREDILLGNSTVVMKKQLECKI